MKLDANASTISLTQEKEKVVINLLSLLSQCGGDDIDDYTTAMMHIGLRDNDMGDDEDDEEEDEEAEQEENEDEVEGGDEDEDEEGGNAMEKREVEEEGEGCGILEVEETKKCKIKQGLEQEAPGKGGMNKQAVGQTNKAASKESEQWLFARQLIRDDRKRSVDEQTKKDLIKAALKTHQSKMYSMKQQQVQQCATPSLIVSKLLPNVRVRVSLQGKESSSKLLVLARSAELASVVIEAKNKLNASKRYKHLVIVLRGVAYGLSPAYLRGSLLDDSALILTDTAPAFSTDAAILDDPLSRGLRDAIEAQIAQPATLSGHSETESLRMSEQSDGEEELGEKEPVAAQYIWTLPVPLQYESWQQTARCIDSELSMKMKASSKLVSCSCSMRDIRTSLPIYKHRDDLLAAVRNNPLVVVSGDTGSGKTTQVPQYLLEDMIERDCGSEAFIVCTQPRRIAAISVAERVAQERTEQCGETIGYQVRFRTSMDVSSTRILFCTTGILLRKLQDLEFLKRISHIVIDEAHERQLDSDFLMALLRTQTSRFPHLRVVFMSATIQESAFASYLSCPVLYIEGRTFPIEQHFLDDVQSFARKAQWEASGKTASGSVDGTYDSRRSKGALGGNKKAQQKLGVSNDNKEAQGRGLIRPPRFDADLTADLVIRIIEQFKVKPSRYSSSPSSSTSSSSSAGDAILVFLSGIQAIRKVDFALRRRRVETLNVEIIYLHGSLPPEDQKKVFRQTKVGHWKVVLCTNIAETSITVDDVSHVIDCGMCKEIRYDPIANISSLQEVVISKASARQRSGRAGRVKSGHCWKMYSQEFFNASELEATNVTTKAKPCIMLDFSLPEILRIPLEETILKILLLQLGHPEIFLKSCLDPPSDQQIRAAVVSLMELGAVVANQDAWVKQTLQQKAATRKSTELCESFPLTPLTPLGYHLAQMPVDVRLGKMLIYSCIFGCVEPVLTIAAALGGKSPLSRPPQADENEIYTAHNAFAYSREPSSNTSSSRLTDTSSLFFSDHLSIVAAYTQWEEVLRIQGTAAARTFCQRHYLSFAVLEEMKRLREMFKGYLRDTGFLQGEEREQNELEDICILHGEDEDIEVVDSALCSASIKTKTEVVPQEPVSSNALIRCIILAGLSPQIARVCKVPIKEPKKAKTGKKSFKGSTEMKVVAYQADGCEVFLDRSSVTHRHLNSLLGPGKFIDQKEAFLVYHKKVATGAGKVYLHDCTAVPAIGVLLFSSTAVSFAGSIKLSKTRRKVEICGWIRFKIEELHAVLLKKLHSEVETVLRLRVESPSRDIGGRQLLLRAVVEALLDS